MVAPSRRKTNTEPWDDEHVKALLRFPRFPMRLLQQEPWQSWIGQRGGLKAVYAYLKEYPLPPSHRRILDVVLSNPESVSTVYADRLNISRATYFYQLRQLIPALVQALNEWRVEDEHASSDFEAGGFLVQPALPVPVTSLVGAEGLLQTLGFCLQREEVHLLTILGPGGIGKTRLAIEVAQRLRDRFNDQICFIDLSSLREPPAMAMFIAQSLGLKQTGIEALKSYLRPRSFLLILDNFEHLLPARALVAELLSTAPRLKILVTSRAVLHLYGEHEFVVPPLPLPVDEQDVELASRSPAVSLFVQRAQEVNPSFMLTKKNLAAVIELCRRMEGIPLAIEWAAFQIKYLSPQALLVHLAHKPRIEFLSQSSRRLLPSHQQTMRDMLDWSYNLLSDDLKILLNRLTIFPDSFTLEAAEAVCNMPASFDVAEGLVSLMDQSLLTQSSASPQEEARFHMSGFLREYALEKLEGLEEVRRYHRALANYYLHLTERFAESWDTENIETRVAQLNREYANLKAAIQWTLEEGESELALRFVVALWDYWRNWGNSHEGRQIAQTALEHSSNLLSPIRARALYQIGWLACDWGEITTMLWAFQNSLQIAEALQDRYGIGLALQGLGELARIQGHWKQARAHLQKSLAIFNELQNQDQMAQSLRSLGRLELSTGNLKQAEAYLRESLMLSQCCTKQSETTSVLVSLGQVLFYQERLSEAVTVLEQSLRSNRPINAERDLQRALALHYLGEIALYQADLLEARKLIDQGLRISKQNGYNGCLELNYFALTLLALQTDDLENAGAWLRECLFLQESLKEPWRSVTLLETTAALLVRRGELLGAARLYGIAASLRSLWKILPMPIYRSLHTNCLNKLKESLTAPMLEDVWRAGQTLSLDQAVTYALRCLE